MKVDTEVVPVERKAITEFSITPAKVAEMAKKYMALTVPAEDTKAYKVARAALTLCVTTRTGTDERRKELGSDARKWVSEVNQAQKDLIKPLAPVEEHLRYEITKEDYRKQKIKDEKERIERERIDGHRKRIEGIAADAIVPPTLNSESIKTWVARVTEADVTEAEFEEFWTEAARVKDTTLNTLTEALDARIEWEKAEEDREAEAKRLANVAAEQEEEKKRLLAIQLAQEEERAVEREKLRAKRKRLEEAEAKAKREQIAEAKRLKEIEQEIERKAKEKQKAEDKRIAAEQKKLDDAKAKFEKEKQAEIDKKEAAREADKTEQARAQQAEQEAIAKAEKEEEDKLAKIKTDEAEAALRKRMLPDKEKLMAWIEFFNDMTVNPSPTLKTEDAKFVLVNILGNLEEFLQDSIDVIEAL